ncbi:transmembrane transporter [Malassezia pachydermatis]
MADPQAPAASMIPVHDFPDMNREVPDSEKKFETIVPERDVNRPGTPELVLFEGEKNEHQKVVSGLSRKIAEMRYGKPQRIQLVIKPVVKDGQVELTREMAFEKTAFGFPWWKKWMILSVIAMVQISMNFNTSVYPNATSMIPNDPRFKGVSEQAARASQMVYLVAYAFGSELWAPWSEELGRWPVLQLSMFLVNIFQLWAVFAPNYENLLAARFFGGLCTAGGSVTLGVVADLYDSDDHQYAIAFVVLSSVIGTSIGPFIGGIVQQLMPLNPLYWMFWLMLIFGGATQLVHALVVPETLNTVLLDREAKRRRKAGQTQYYGPNELRPNRFSMKEIGIYWLRPFYMFVTEPIVLFLSLLSGFSDALIFIFEMSFDLVFGQWFGKNHLYIGLTFLTINIGYIVAFFSFFPTIMHQRKMRRVAPEKVKPEDRLWWLLFLAPLEIIGLFGFAWTSLGPPHVHWIAPIIFAFLIAIANYAIYMATIDYMVEAYGMYSASATGGNALARDLLAGISAMFAVPMYEGMGSEHSLEWASTLLGFVSILVIVPIFVFYFKGETIRSRSKFAQALQAEKETPGPPEPPEEA